MKAPAGRIKRVLLVEPSASGHHMALYLRHVVKGLVAEGIDVSLLTTKEAAADPAYGLVEAELPADAKIHFFRTARGPLRENALGFFFNQVSNWFRLRHAVRRVGLINSPDVVYVPTVDWIAKAIEVFGSPFGRLPFVALYMSPKHHRFATGIGPKSRSDSIYNRLFQRFLRIPTLKKVLVIDEIFYEFATNQYGPLSNKIAFAPDFGVVQGKVPKELARTKLGIPATKKVVLIYGSLTLRKGIHELLLALTGQSAPEDIAILLAGRPSAEVKDIIKQPKFLSLTREGRLFTQFKFHDSNDECEVFAAADCVWIAYVQKFYGSSGVLHQSVSYGVPVIASNAGLIGYLVRKFRIGVTVDPRKSNTVHWALKELSRGVLRHDAARDELNFFKRKYSAASHASIVIASLK